MEEVEQNGLYSPKQFYLCINLEWHLQPFYIAVGFLAILTAEEI